MEGPLVEFGSLNGSMSRRERALNKLPKCVPFYRGPPVLNNVNIFVGHITHLASVQG